MKRKYIGILGLVLLSFLAVGAFAETSDSREAAAPKSQVAASGKMTGRSGYTPSPVDLSHIKSADYSAFLDRVVKESGPLPRQYASQLDLRDQGYITPVQNQGDYGTCWAFASLGSLESTYWKEKGKRVDLSVKHLAWYAYKDKVGFDAQTPENVFLSGGNYNMAIATMARWTGPVLNQYLPYAGNTFPSGVALNYPNRLHMSDAFFVSLNPYSTGATNDVRKALITQYGPIAVSFYASDPDAYNETFYSWKNASGSPTEVDHGALIVGWDDTFPRGQFNSGYTPESDGAWLVKGSWGESFGDEGYFWLSYEEPSLSQGVVFIGDDTDRYDNNYGYDELGWCVSATLDTTVTSWMANCFRAKSEGETLEAVSFYTTAPNTTYDLYIYTELPNNENPVSGPLMYQKKSSFEFAGYHTVEIDPGVSLRKGARFSVVLRMQSPYSYPLAIEYTVPGYSMQATSNRGESYFSTNGVEWHDGKDTGEGGRGLTLYREQYAPQDGDTTVWTPVTPLTGQGYLDVNACIRAFTTVGSSVTPLLSFSETRGTWYARQVDVGTGNTLVRIYGRVMTDSLPKDVSVVVDGLTNVSAWIGDASGGKYDDASVTTKSAGMIGATGNRFLIIEGQAPAASADSVSVTSVSYTLDGVQRVQDFQNNPIAVSQMQTGDPTVTTTGGGGGGCNAGLGGLAIVAIFCSFAFTRRRAGSNMN